MALSHIQKFIFNNATDEVARRGKQIHQKGYVEFMEHDEFMGSVTFRVRDDHYSTSYKVHVQKYQDPKALMVRCACPYNLGDICRHEAAALMQLQEYVDKSLLGTTAITYDQSHTIVKMRTIDLKTIRMLTSAESFEAAENALRTQKANILRAGDERVEALLHLEGEDFNVVVQKNEERNFDTSCRCGEDRYPLCIHKTALLLQLLNAFGPHYFDTIRNWDKEKNKLLEAYGYSLSEPDWSSKFEFTYKEGKPFLRVLDPAVKRIVPVQADWSRMRAAEQEAEAKLEVQEPEQSGKPNRLAIVFQEQSKGFPRFTVEGVTGDFEVEEPALKGRVEKLELGRFVPTDDLSAKDAVLLQSLRKLHVTEINKYVSRNSPFAGIWENIIHNEDEGLPVDTEALIIEYIHPKIRKLFNEHGEDTLFFRLPMGKAFTTKNLLPLKVEKDGIRPVFHVRREGKGYRVACKARVRELEIDLKDNEWSGQLLLLYGDTLYFWEKPEDYDSIRPFLCSSEMKIPASEWKAHLKDKLLPLSQRHKVEFDESMVREVKGVKPETRLHLQERGDYLMFVPVFNYKDHEARYGEKDTLVLADGDMLTVIHRDTAAENDFVERLSSLHSNFLRKESPFSMNLKGAEVLRNNWFFLFIDAMREMEVPVTGLDVLRNFRFNTAKPRTRIRIGSGIDWFDADVEVTFGNQSVSISEIKRALGNRQQYVHLDDGSLGILPEEWISKYSLLFRVGDGSKDRLRLSKYHLSVIDELYDARDETEVMIRLEEKYDRLRGFKRIREVDPPERLSHVLRPYQVAGYHWLNYLSEVGWGGILADDMGLGKTVQALSFLQSFRDRQGRLTALVVCPTTLMFNWENEIRKFTPGLRHLIHHGGERGRNKSVFEGYDVVITTYGTLRSDIKMLVEVPFDYVVLDESQAIKNPHSKVTKAATLLQARNRLCMSGTPLQNNTFDIYAQMNFLNPGMLGSVEFFRNEFATPIDKFGEKEQKDHLRRLLYPFILRRTKEQVARDLPEKTETILFCEMEDEQRKIYESFRNDYRSKILGLINEQGIDKSQLTILQGLMKLRQICDSPAIMNEPEKYPNVSIKLDEISRELLENIGDHKALIFSQYLGMLALIRERLNELGVAYEYFDGSTSAQDREKAIRNFQDSEQVRVFLISLKAGGVGLNLTAADYVYIVDPWWNPAVEQQAIDRTHRIGQTKNIFAYRMICRDTIEDKILQLQEKKRALARDLIADEATFVKKLTREDVEYLFS
jgi:non-specific serine/threonine protein kinase